MTKVYDSVLDLVGNTPIVNLKNIKRDLDLKANIFAKLEYFNPSGSVKDRIVKAMILKAYEKGEIKEGDTIIEATSGNTGIGIAMICASLFLKAILVMPETMSIERRSILKFYGADIVLTEGSKGMKGAIEKAKELNSQIYNSHILWQFENEENPKIHKSTTGVEIYSDMNKEVDIFISGVGTGGTLSGAGAYLKEQKSDIKIVAVEPEASAVLSGENAGSHKIQGIGAGFIPNTLDISIIDEIIKVSNESAFETSKYLAKKEGIACGISSGAALSVAIELAKLEENKNKNIVVILPDSADRYYSTALFE